MGKHIPSRDRDLTVKKITILFVPDGARGVRQLRIPRFLLTFSALFLIACTVFISLVLKDYRAMKSQMIRLSRLEKEAVHHREQSLLLAQRIQEMTRKMDQLNELDRKLRIMVNLEPPEEDSVDGMGGPDPLSLSPRSVLQKGRTDLIRSMHHTLDNLGREIAFGKKEKRDLIKFLESQKMLLACTPSIWPAKGWLSSRFGYRISPFTGEKEFHRGIDISGRINSPVLAPADGMVSAVFYDYGYGRVVTITHGYGLETLYGHLQKVLVKKGQFVKRGETIALLGNTGRSTGPHLHYEVHLNRVAVNPLRYILN